MSKQKNGSIDMKLIKIVIAKKEGRVPEIDLRFFEILQYKRFRRLYFVVLFSLQCQFHCEQSFKIFLHISQKFSNE